MSTGKDRSQPHSGVLFHTGPDPTVQGHCGLWTRCDFCAKGRKRSTLPTFPGRCIHQSTFIPASSTFPLSNLNFHFQVSGFELADMTMIESKNMEKWKKKWKGNALHRTRLGHGNNAQGFLLPLSTLTPQAGL